MSQALTQDELKTLVGRAALEHVPAGSVVGVGTGSTVDKFIDALGEALKADPKRVSGAVSSSVRSTQRLEALGVPVLAAEAVTGLGVYIDGADEIDHAGNMIKGGGAALTREKIVAELAERFVCIADESKLVQALGKFPLPLEVLEVPAGAQPETALHEASDRARKLDGGEGVLVLTDLYGATPCNVAHRLPSLGLHMHCVSGLNLPMLLRVLNYPEQSLDELAQTAASGGRGGIFIDHA